MSGSPTIGRSQRYFVNDEKLIEKRRQQIFEAAVKLFGQNGYRNTTVREIAVLAGVSTGLTYQYCQDKEDVLFLVLKRVVETYLQNVAAAASAASDPWSKLEAVFVAFCRTADVMQLETLLTYRHTKSLSHEKRHAVKEIESRTSDMVCACVRACMKQTGSSELNVEILGHQLMMLAHGWALKQWRLRDIVTIDQYIDNGLLFFRSVLGR